MREEIENKKRTHIYYRHLRQDITFAFEEGFTGRIQGPDHSGLICTVLNDEDDATIVYITQYDGEELLRVVFDK